MAQRKLEIIVEEVLKSPDVGKELNKQIKDIENNLKRLSLAGKQGGTEWNNYSQKLSSLTTIKRDLNKEIKNLSGNLNTSSKNTVAFSRDITVLAFGLQQGIKGLIDFGKELHKIASEGAEVAQMKDHFIQMNGGIEQATQKFELLRQAASGNLNDKEILQYINKLDELGYSTEESTQILDFAERKADDLGTSIEGATDKVVKFIETGRGKGFEQYGISISDINKKMEDLSGLTEKQINNLTDESAQRLRSQAFLDLYGDSLDKINTKEKDQADKLKSVQTELDNAKLRMGSFIANGLVKLEEHLGLSTKGTSDLVVAIGTVGGGIIGLLPAIGGLTTALKVAGVEGAVLASTMKTLGAIGTITITVVVVYEIVKKLVDMLNENSAEIKKSGDLLQKAREEAIRQLEEEAKTNTSADKPNITKKGELSPIPKFDVGSDVLPSGFIQKFDETLIQDRTDKILEKWKKTPIVEGTPTPKWKPDFKPFIDKGKNEKEKDITGELIKDWRLRIDYTQTFRTINSDLLVDISDEVEKQLAITENMEDQVKLGKLLNDITDIGNKLLQRREKTTKLPGQGKTTPERIGIRKKQVEGGLGGVGETFEESTAKSSEIIEQTEINFADMVSDAQIIADILGIGAHTFVSQLLSGLQSGISLASSIASLLASIASLASGKGFFGLSFAYGGTVPHYPTGGLLTGRSHSHGGIPLIAEGGEFIFSKKATARLGTPLLNYLNGTPGNLGMYKQLGGFISNRQSNQTIVNKIYLKGTLSGQKFLKDEFPDFEKYKQEISY